MLHARHWRRLAAGASIALACLAAAAPAAADHASRLRAQNAALRARERSVLYALYARDAAIARAQVSAAAAQRRSAALAVQAHRAQVGLQTSRRNLTIARRFLSEDLVQLYKADRPDPVEIFLGASSLDSALTELDGLRRAATLNATVALNARRARTSYASAVRVLEQRQSAASAAKDAADAHLASLAVDRAAKHALLEGLRSERRRVRRSIVHLDAVATAAAHRSQQLAAQAATRHTAAPTTTAPSPVPTATATPPPTTTTTSSTAPGSTLTVSATSYSLPGHTASGLPVGPGICATDPSVIPLGTRFDVPGYGTCLAADTGSAIIGDRIDVWLPTLAQADAWGRQTVTITFR